MARVAAGIESIMPGRAVLLRANTFNPMTIYGIASRIEQRQFKCFYGGEKLMIAFALDRLFNRPNYAIKHFLFCNAQLAPILPWIRGEKVFFALTGMIEGRLLENTKGRIVSWKYQKCLEYADKVIYMDGSSRDDHYQAFKKLNLKDKPSLTIPCPLNVPKILNNRRHDHARDVIKVLFVGRITESKGIVELLDAVKLLVSEGKRVDLFLLGAAHDEERSQFFLKMAEKTGANLCFSGMATQDYVRDCYSKCDVCVVPSYNESWGMAHIDALAAGIPLVSTAMPSLEAIPNSKQYYNVVRAKSHEDIFIVLERFYSENIKEVKRLNNWGDLPQLHELTQERIADAVIQFVSGESR